MIDISNKYKASDTAKCSFDDGIAISLEMSDVSSFSAWKLPLVNYFSNNKYLQD
jgi:TPP-dependent pyruvate/acetoin dehydrogenase alpha subunit